MPSRFSSQYDYSQVFSSLARQAQQDYEAAARRLDAEREAELAARDSLVFTQWQEGKISGQQLMAHINTRMRQTGYDREQQLRWREAAVEYGNIIADETAEAAYAENNNIYALIQHYTQRAAGTKRGTPEYRQIQERLRSLKDKRDADHIAKRARQIARQINNGKMSTKDLLQFYREQLPGLTGDLRQQVMDNISELRNKLRSENFEAAMLRIDNQLETGHISPQDAASQKVDVLKKFNIQSTDKVAYQQWMGQVRELRAMPDPAEISQLELDLAQERITPEQYVAKINEWADRIAPYDLDASWQLRIEAQRFIEEEATPLTDPQALGQRDPAAVAPGGGSRGFSGTVEVVKRLRGNAIKHITQLDNSRFSQFNCTMASGAMLAHAMGYTGLTGADLRNLSGVTTSATNIQQLQGALNKVGVDGTRLRWDERIEFDRFKQAVSRGAPAVLSGWNGDIPAQFNASGIIGGHAMFVAGYDAKRDAFLMLDPAKSNDSGTWWPASVVEDFGWGGQRHGQALLAPAGTIDPTTLRRAGGKVKHINVTAKPTNPNVPPIESRTEPPNPSQRMEVALKKRLRMQRERLRDAGISDAEQKKLTTKQKVESMIDRQGESIEELESLLEEYAILSEEDPDGIVQSLTTGETMTPQDVAELQRQLIYLWDGQEQLYKGIGSKAKAAEARQSKTAVLFAAKALNSQNTSRLINEELRNVTSALEDWGSAKSADEYRAGIDELKTAIATIADLSEPDEEELPEDATPADEQAARVETVGTDTPELDMWAQINDLLDNADDSQTLLDEMAALQDELDLDEATVTALDTITGAVAANVDLENGEATMMLLPGPEGHRLEVVPLRETQVLNPETGELEDATIPDLSVLGPEMNAYLSELGYNATNLPVAQLPDASADNGVARVSFIPNVAPYEGVELLSWGEGIASQSGASMLESLGVRLDGIESGQVLDDATVSQLATTPGLIQALQEQDVLETTDANGQPLFLVQQLEWDGTTYYQDRIPTPDGGVQTVWHKDNLPWIGRAPDEDALVPFESRYFGGEIVNGQAWAEVNSTDYDETDTGEMIPNLGLAPEQAAEDIVTNGGIPDVVYSRDPIDPQNIVAVQPGDIRHPTTPGTNSISEFIKESQRTFKKTMDKVASRLEPEQVVEFEVMNDIEKRNRAIAMGIDPETGEWAAGPLGGGTAQKPPSQALLQELGIRTQTEPEEEQTAPQFDHLQAARDAARGLNAARKAEIEARKAAREAQMKAQQQIKSSIPKITAPPKLPKPYLAPTPTPKPARTTTTQKSTKPSAPKKTGVGSGAGEGRPELREPIPTPTRTYYSGGR